MSGSGRDLRAGSRREAALRAGGWIVVLAVIAAVGWHLAWLGLDIRQDFWVYFTPNHENGDANSALEHGDAVLREAETVAAGDEARKSPQQRDLEARLSGGSPPATIEHPGPGLFDPPVDWRTFVSRWHRLRPVYGQILRGWVQSYERLYQDQGPQGDYEMDYPPARLLVMTLWAWRVESNYPGITSLPHDPQRVFNPDLNRDVVATMDIVQPLLKVNAFCEGVTALAIFVLVWMWMERGARSRAARVGGRDEGWGNWMLLAPVAAFGVANLVWPHISWQMPLASNANDSLIDARVTRVGWWVLLFLRYLSVICLARFLPRPYRAPMCALVAGSLAWLNPSSLPDSFGWPQWDCWLPPFFLVAAVLISLDWWLAAGVLVGVGCMFKGQLLFVSPVLLLCPLLAGWPGRFFRVAVGTMVGAGMVIWPWLVTNQGALRWVFLGFTVGGFFCALSVTRGFLRRQIVELWDRLAADLPRSLTRTMLLAATAFGLSVAALIFAIVTRHGTPAVVALFAVSIFVMPWVLPRRLLGAWLAFCFAMPLWLVGAYAGGSRTWWDIGFMYGTQRHPDIQLGANSLSNLSSLLHERYGWALHDHAATIALPGLKPIDLDMQALCGAIFGAAILLCSVAAAVHMRRRDARFLIVLIAPWVLFTILLTQMTARYMTLPAVLGSMLVGISAEMSLLPFLQTVLACVMLGNQMLQSNPDTAPVTVSITQQTFPDLGWLTVLLAAIFLVSAMMPTQRWRRAAERL